jgi:hypothetical protein
MCPTWNKCYWKQEEHPEQRTNLPPIKRPLYRHKTTAKRFYPVYVCVYASSLYLLLHPYKFNFRQYYNLAMHSELQVLNKII